MFDLKTLIKYLLEGLAVAVAVFLIPKRKIHVKEIALIALTAAAIFAVLDTFSPTVAISARQGSGFAIGYQQVGLGADEDTAQDGLEGYDDYEHEDYREDFANSGDCQSPENYLVSKKNVCKMDGDRCTYDPTAKEEQISRFLCRKTGQQCQPVRACKKNKNGVCMLTDEAKNLPQAEGRTCHTIQQTGKTKCRLMAEDSDQIEGFEGFSKVF